MVDKTFFSLLLYWSKESRKVAQGQGLFKLWFSEFKFGSVVDISKAYKPLKVLEM